MGARLIGKTLAGRYDLIELLGAGGMGEVYRARDRELDELVALKVIRADLASEPDVVARFRHEVKLARRVTHPNVARTFELGTASELMFCTMQLVDGESLAQRLAHARRLPVEEAATIACSVCDGLAAAHAADVIHRDIKPANVLLASDGRIVVADFGIASAPVGDGADTSGTPAYMAPEQARGEPPTPATDIYAVGVLLYEMVTGTRPFAGDPRAVFDAKQTIERLVIDGELAGVIGRATARDPADRFPTAAALSGALARWRTSPMPSSGSPARIVRPTFERTVLVVAPRTSPDDPRTPIANAIHEELLVALGRGRWRTLPRAGVETADVVLELAVAVAVDETLVLRASRAGEDTPAVTLHVPLAIQHLSRSVALATRAVEELFVDARNPIDDGAYELLVRARHEARRGPSYFVQPLAMLERAHALCPDDPRIRASVASMLIRRAFFSDTDTALLERAAEHVRLALAAAPGLVESHLAAGHLELQIGDPTKAAGHYRVAIACSPHTAEAHDHLGRMLLEAGYLDAALARLEHATAISPGFRTVTWELARALALEQRWDEHDQIVSCDEVHDRPISRARYLWWRGELDPIRESRSAGNFTGVFDRELLELLFAGLLDGDWERVRAPLIAKAEDRRSLSNRRRAFVAQLVAEIAGCVGDVDTCTRVLAHATRSAKLFDLHWVDRCPSLAIARGTPAFAAVREEILARSRAIYDALYSDHAVAVGATALATS